MSKDIKLFFMVDLCFDASYLSGPFMNWILKMSHSLFDVSGAADIYTSSKWICCGKPGRVGTCLRFDMSAAHLCLLRLFVCVFFLLSFINTVVATVNSINMLLHFGFGVSEN